LRGRGAVVDFVAAYRRLAPALDADGRALLAAALQRPREHLWIFSSSEAIGRLRELAPAADWSAARALVTHPRIADAARAAGFGEVRQSAPAAAVVARAAGNWPIESVAP
ncbi:MAG TPA: uroporphyrinogen-III synthase, partial [Rubrivivax sp.]|nr:uroporphyrinogen-III synthase [Rubrivivax sp.]